MLRDGMLVDVSDGLTGLHYATLFNQKDVIKHLVHEGADVNRQAVVSKDTPLHIAERNNYTEIVRLLLDYNADIELKNNNNKTPLDETDEEKEVHRMLIVSRWARLMYDAQFNAAAFD